MRADGGVPGRRRARAFLAGRGVELGGEQQTKTRKALEFFAKHLANGQSQSRPARKRAAPAKAS